jgi:glutamate-1-semialdehyde 2,1-aminomutase
MSPSTPASDIDREFFSRELDSFLPDRIFDAHTHLWKQECVAWSIPGIPNVGRKEYTKLIADLHGSRPTEALFIPFATENNRDKVHTANKWVSDSVQNSANSRGLFFITPDDDPEQVRDQVKELGLHGLKCYHSMASVNPTWEASIPDFLPEPFLEVANQESWCITLHMVKTRAVADPDNLHWIRHYCESYPNMKLILAHSARGFQPAHNLEGLAKLKGLDNLYFDTSANCEPIAHQAIMRIIGPDRLMYGSDLPVSHMRGRSLGVADTFLWLYEDTPVWNEKHRAIQPLLIGLEHLQSVKMACWSERLTDSQVEDIFWNNAARLFGVSC